MKLTITFALLVLLFSCTEEDHRFNFSSFSEEEKKCFKNSFLPFTTHNGEAQKMIETKANFYIQGKLVNKSQGINHNFFMIESLDSTELIIREGVQYASTDPNILVGSSENLTTIISWFDLFSNSKTIQKEFSFGFHVEFTPQEVGSFNSSYEKFFTQEYLKLTSSKQYFYDAPDNEKTGFQLNFLMGCKGVTHPNGVRQFWLPSDGNKDSLGKILSYEREDNKDFYTYKVKIDISGKLYQWGTIASKDSYFADIEDGILFMKFDQKK